MAKRAAETAANPDKQAKQLRSNFDEAKKLLDTIPLVHWRLQVHRWEWLVETIDQNLAILQRGIERMQVAPSTHLEKILPPTTPTSNDILLRDVTDRVLQLVLQLHYWGQLEHASEMAERLFPNVRC